MEERIFGWALLILAILLIIFGSLKVYKNYYDQKIETQKSMDVVLYTKAGCRYCIMAKNLLDRIGITYNNIDISNNPELQKKLVSETGQNTVPYVFIKDTLIGGYTDLAELNNNGKLLNIAIEQNEKK